MTLKITGEGKILQRRGSHNHEAVPALVQVQQFFFSFYWSIQVQKFFILFLFLYWSIQVQKLEAEKMEEILKNPETATGKKLLLAISEEILNPEMAAFASSFNTIQRKLHRRLKKMKEVQVSLLSGIEGK